MDFLSRLSIPKIKCGERISSGFLVSKDKVITALHAITPFLSQDVDEVEVIFINEQGEEIIVLAEPIILEEDKWEDYQIIVLNLKKVINDISTLECINYKFNNTTNCFTYGYPAVSEIKGTLIDLEIRDELKGFEGFFGGSNLDVKVKSDPIKDYKGCSGGPLLYKNRVVGVMLEQSSENGEASRLSAVSLYIYSEYLKKIGIPIVEKVYDLDFEDYLVSKKQYIQKQLDNTLKRNIEKVDINPLGFPIKIQSKQKSRDLNDFTQLLEDNDSAIILSKPGGGKTYLLRMLMLEAMENPISGDKIPVLLKAKDWYREYRSIIEGIKKELMYELPNLTNEKIIQALKEGKFILLIDGFDEIRSNKDLFIGELQRLKQFEKLKVIITCRQQNYHNEFNNLLSEYDLKPLTDEQIRDYIAAVFEENISYPFAYSLKKSLKDLIENPLFLYMTAQVMKNTNRVIPKNKSELYDVFIEYIMMGRVFNNGIIEELQFDLELKLDMLADYAFTNFRDIDNSKNFSEVASKYINRQDVLLLKRELLKTGVLVEDRNRLDFFHPSIEEYFVALKISKMNEQEILIYIQKYHLDESFIEVFKFVSGLLRNSKRQNVVLDKLEESNIYLYRHCLQSRFNFKSRIEEKWSKQYLNDYLKQLRKSYLVIIDTFFKKIKTEFYPWCEAGEGVISNEDIVIIGSLDVNTASLTVEIEIGKNRENIIIRESLGAPSMIMKDKDGKDMSIPIFTLNSGNHWYFNLETTDLGLDSSREVAMYIIKKQLKELIDKQKLFIYESPESIIPCIEYILKRLPFEYFSVERDTKRKRISLYDHPIELILKVLTFGDNIFKYLSSRRAYGDLNQDYVASNLYKLFEFAESKVEFKHFLLPKADLEPILGERTSYWIWEEWSDDGIKERLSTFFDFYQKSYRNLVENCFSAFKEYMPLYSMGPVRFLIGLERNNENGGGISFSWEPVESMEDTKPIIENKKEERLFEEYENKNAELDRALLQLNRKGMGGYSYSTSSLTEYINDDRKLRNKLYKQILKDLEYVLGKLQ
ncbi:NACHT domain-containing protein [Bacillus sp. EB93]|nr:NACHT domain-containing protein [Peribacillus frigoritolerans]